MADKDQKIEFPQVYKNEKGASVVASNDVQASAFENNGFKPAGKYVEKQAKTDAQATQVE